MSLVLITQGPAGEIGLQGPIGLQGAQVRQASCLLFNVLSVNNDQN